MQLNITSTIWGTSGWYGINQKSVDESSLQSTTPNLNCYECFNSDNQSFPMRACDSKRVQCMKPVLTIQCIWLSSFAMQGITGRQLPSQWNLFSPVSWELWFYYRSLLYVWSKLLIENVLMLIEHLTHMPQKKEKRDKTQCPHHLKMCHNTFT